MNKQWSELNKTMQSQLKKKDTYQQGFATLFDLRNSLMDTINSFKQKLSRDDFSAIPFINADGYHNKTIAYSLWHIFRIEDIVAHTLIKGDEQIFFKNDYQNRIGSKIVTTGNELVKQEIADFSKDLDLNQLYSYIREVKTNTEDIISELTYSDLKTKISDEKKNTLKSLKVVSENENAIWLVDYWCNKDFGGLIQMPFSRHWIMHIEACLRIANKLESPRKITLYLQKM